MWRLLKALHSRDALDCVASSATTIHYPSHENSKTRATENPEILSETKMPIKEQFDAEGRIEDAEEASQVAGLSHDYYLLMVVLVVLGCFYLVIMYILTSANSDRLQRLNKLKHS